MLSDYGQWWLLGVSVNGSTNTLMFVVCVGGKIHLGSRIQGEQ